MRRLGAGGSAIDRSRPLTVRFDDRELAGFAGDTLASALLANDRVDAFASPILGRPRGVMTAGVEEPNAFVEVTAPWFDPIVAATRVPAVEGLVAASRPGVGVLPLDPLPVAATEHRHRHVETLVIGAGPSGVAVAREAAARGYRTILVEEANGAADVTLEADGVTVLTGTTAAGVYDDGYVVLHERPPNRERIWHVRARRVVLATGAIERPIPFAGNDLPGVMLAGAAWAYVTRYGILPGERAVVFTTNHWAYTTARVLRDAGAEVLVVDASPEGSAMDQARADGIEVLGGWAVAAAQGDRRVGGARLSGPGGASREVEADLIAVSGGWNPNLTLYRGIGGGLRYDEARSCFVPDGSAPAWLEVIGAATGDDLPTGPVIPYVPANDLSLHFVELQRDQTVADVLGAVRRGLTSTEHVKRATYIGTAIDQGRTSGVVTAQIVNAALGLPQGSEGPTNARPPAEPIPFVALAGPDRGALLDPERRTPMHAWHVEHGAVFENVGQWKRPWYFPVGAETLDEAVARECLAVRERVGVMDASTLGKIEVVGPDAAAFLDRVYTNRMSTLAVGSIRYGLMLGLDGMVLDDGVAMRLAEDRYLLTTTTGGAAKVLDHLEEWLQTEWPELQVFCTSVTEQWAVAAVNGPLAREVVAATAATVDLSNEAFPFMTWRDAEVAGIPARLCRVSFSGELAYELHVAWWHGAALWEAVMAAGEPFGLTPYGTEAMHVLRAEKGYVIVGQDTDGTVTPLDLGMSWIVRKDDSDFTGKRSLRRPDTAREGRKQLVGLLTEDPAVVLPEGAQLVEGPDVGEPPVPMLGHVTSSYRSPVLGRSIALAMVSGGASRHGDTIHAALADGSVPVEVTSPVFYDPEGARRDG
jgi:sarcosine oxidase subunit alpha